MLQTKHSSTPSAATHRRSKTLPVPIQKIADRLGKAVQLSAVSKQIAGADPEISDRVGISIVLTHSDPERILHDTDALHQ